MKTAALVLLTGVGLFIVSGCCEPECDTGCYTEPVAVRVVPAEVTPAPVPPPAPPAPPPPPAPDPRPPRPQSMAPQPVPYCDPCASFGRPLDGPVTLGGELIHLQPVDGTGTDVARR